jgi:hypothetical protein
VVKIDVEGAELDVLRGMGWLLDQRQVRELFIEAHPRFLVKRGESTDDIDRFLTERGYQLVSVRQRNLERHLHYRLGGGTP